MVDGINFDQSLLKGAITKRSERKKANDAAIQSAFTAAKADGQLNKQEIAKLKEMGLTEAQINELKKSTDGMQTLNNLAYSHLGTDFGVKTGDNAATEIKQQRQVEITEFVLDDEVKTYEDFEARLAKFEGVEFVDDKFKAEAENLYQTEKLGRAKTTFTPDVQADPEAKPITIRVQAETAEGGTITKLNLYDEVKQGENPDNAKPTKSLVADGKYFIEGEGDNVKYYSYNAKEGTLTEVTSKAVAEKQQAKEAAELAPYAKFVPTDAAELEEYNKLDHAGKLAYLQGKQKEAEAQQVIADRKEAFANIKQNGITIDETGSTQRLTAKNQWHTDVVIPKKATTNDDGFPSQIAIALPGGYGSTNADGVGQKRYQTLYFNAETNTYSDKRGLRQFEVIVDDGKITLKQKDAEAASARVKEVLDNDTRIVQERAQKAALNDEQNKFKKEMSDNDVAQLKAGLSNRNTAWETYLQAGTENGYLTGTYGLLEELFDEGHVKTYDDIKPMLEGLMAGVPESAQTSPEYNAAKTIIDNLAASPQAKQKTAMFFQFQGGNIRDLDKALINLAKTHMAGKVQGTNHANNAYLVGGGGKVTIQPEKQSRGWMTDAKFTIGGQDYYLKKENGIVDRTIDFQDLVEHKEDGTRNHLSLLSNDVVGNNRLGYIKANADKFGNGDFYFEGGDGLERHCIVENGIVYVQSPNGQVKVPLEDVLNGKRPMPQDPAAS